MKLLGGRNIPALCMKAPKSSSVSKPDMNGIVVVFVVAVLLLIRILLIGDVLMNPMQRGGRGEGRRMK